MAYSDNTVFQKKLRVSLRSIREIRSFFCFLTWWNDCYHNYFCTTLKINHLNSYCYVYH